LLIEEYFLSLERVLASYSQIQRVTLTKDRRAPTIGLVKGEIVFSAGLQLFIMEFVRTEPRVAKTKYRYHCQDASGTPIFRYDNAPHHSTETFPDHKHVFSSSAGETIIVAQPPTIDTLLDEVIQLEAKG
jgi:Family of unknown function (DUF6516)